MIGTAVISLTEETDAEGLSNVPSPIKWSNWNWNLQSPCSKAKPLSRYSRWPPFDCKEGTASVFFTLCISSTWLMLSNRSSNIYWMSLRSVSTLTRRSAKKLRAHIEQQPVSNTTLLGLTFEYCIPRNGVSTINPASLPMFLSSLTSTVGGEEGWKQIMYVLEYFCKMTKL